jgi:hypothetical protein
MNVSNWAARWILILAACASAPTYAQAETKLSDFNGTWQGIGTDRNTPFESAQQTRCSATINADLRRMSTGITCHGAAGLDKVIKLTIALIGDGDAFSGNLTQTATTRDDPSIATNLSGAVAGRKTDKTAEFKVSFPGLTPSVNVTLTLSSPSSFAMQATTLGGQLMDLTFNRASKP